ncbi:MAG TPA: hypothetical protein VMX55_12735 [candidate division Zixibacteria bacterium]|nr:hypothetical protein [candidate division Zixibacteria bacterium]
MAENELYMILGIVGIFIAVIGVIFWSQIRQARKRSSLEQETHVSPSSFDAESKTKMMTRLDKRESQLRRERILEGGTLPELSELMIYSPTKDEKINTPEVDVRGKTAVRSIVWINNQAAFVDVDGSFIGSVPLYRGKNNVSISVIGPYGSTLRTSLTINCTSKQAPPMSATDPEFLLPKTGLDIRFDDSTETTTYDNEDLSIDDGVPSRKFISKNDGMVVSESEIDPSVLAALKGDPIADIPIDIPEPVDLETIEPEFLETEIPDIPDITGPDESVIPDIPDVDLEADEESPSISEDDKSIEKSVKEIEEVVKTDLKSEEIDDKKFPLDKMMPLQPGEKGTADSLAEFQPLKHELDEGIKTLKVETKRQKLKDDRETEILQHTGYISQEDGEMVQIIKLEKRVEKISKRWYSTIGLVNVSNFEISKLEISEFIGSTLELKEALPINIQEPVIDSLPEGVKVTWTINSIKPEQKLFITYNEDVNTLETILEEKITPTITIRK